MTEAERKRQYNGMRVLMDVDDILSSPYPGLGVSLTGAQANMLRNMMAYLNRQSTYVAEYHDNYYIMPDDTDFSAIIEIVADLEGKLMMTENTLYGYNDRWAQSMSMLKGGAGTAVYSIDDVDAGEILVLLGMCWINQTGVRGTMQLQVRAGAHHMILANGLAQPQFVPLIWTGRIELKEGDLVVAKQTGAQDNDSYTGAVWGTKMIVPG